MSTIVHFIVPVEDLERAERFYGKLFGWRIFRNEEFPDYLGIMTHDEEGRETLGGGLSLRKDPAEGITNFIGVDSVEEHSAKVAELGGKVLVPKTAVPGEGWMVICQDPDNNTFGLWEEDKQAL
jgi:predicted enzyme related to lactoylglutathione lyase